VPIERLIDRTGYDGPPDELYLDPRFPPEPEGQPDAEARPYVFINMVSTVDGKTLVGQPGSTAKGLGEPTDQILMRRLEAACDCAVIGAGTLRPGNVIYPPHVWRAVITRSGDLPLNNRFFTDAPDRAIVLAPRALPAAAREALGTSGQVRIVGETVVDPVEAVRLLRREFGIRYLLLEGGASTNFDFLTAGVVDELFLSLSPKLKGGEHLPTVVDGAGLPGREYLSLEMKSLYRDGDELYLRYRVGGRQEAKPGTRT
jgi:2,5-diamino-6-(ribosylamino)-4(3H)-pyrimidinone 5'-phosphate reductase